MNLLPSFSTLDKANRCFTDSIDFGYRSTWNPIMNVFPYLNDFLVFKFCSGMRFSKTTSTEFPCVSGVFFLGDPFKIVDVGIKSIGVNMIDVVRRSWPWRKKGFGYQNVYEIISSFVISPKRIDRIPSRGSLWLQDNFRIFQDSLDSSRIGHCVESFPPGYIFPDFFAIIDGIHVRLSLKSVVWSELERVFDHLPSSSILSLVEGI